MKQEKKPFRIDINRLRQKLYDLTPLEEKKAFIKLEKMKDLEILSSQLNVINGDGFNELLKTSRIQLGYDIITCTGLFLGFTIGITSLFFLESPIAISIVTLSIAFCVYQFCKYFRYIKDTTKSFVTFNMTKKQLIERIKILRKELNNSVKNNRENF
jgi:hypothetical protein